MYHLALSYSIYPAMVNTVLKMSCQRECVWNQTCIYSSSSLLSTPTLTTCPYHSFLPLPVSIAPPSSAFSLGVSIFLSIAPFIMNYKYGSLFVVFLDAGSFNISFYRPFIFMFTVFSAAFVSHVLLVLFIINNHHC